MSGSEHAGVQGSEGRSAVSQDAESLAAPETRAREEGAASVVRTPEAQRRLALLWEEPEPATRGRKPRLSLPEVVDAGLRVVSEAGLEALSMRRVAKELAVGAMTLYTYVPGRTELIDLMVDRAFSELRLPQAAAPWRQALGSHAREHYALYLRHPWLLQTNMWRAPLAPHVLDAQEAGLRSLIDTGLPEAMVVQTLGLVDAVVQGLARAAIAERLENDATGQGADEYWESLSSFWVDYFDEQRYPTMTRVYLAGGFDDPADPSEATIERLLDGVDLAIGQTGRNA